MGVLDKHEVRIIGYTYEHSPPSSKKVPNEIFDDSVHTENVKKFYGFRDPIREKYYEENKSRIVFSDEFYMSYVAKEALIQKSPAWKKYFDTCDYGNWISRYTIIKPKSISKPYSTHIDTRTHDLVAHQTRIFNNLKLERFCQSKKCIMCENIDRLWVLKDKTNFTVGGGEYCYELDKTGSTTGELLNDEGRTSITTKDKYNHTKYIKPKHAQHQKVQGPAKVIPRLRCGHITKKAHQNILTVVGHRDSPWSNNNSELEALRKFTQGGYSLNTYPETIGGGDETTKPYKLDHFEILDVRRRLHNLKLLDNAKIFTDDEITEMGEEAFDEQPLPYSLSVDEMQRFAEIQLKRIITFVRTSDSGKYDHPQIKLCDIDRSDLCLLTQKLAGSFRSYSELNSISDDIYVLMEDLATTYTPDSFGDCILSNWKLANKTSMFPKIYDLGLSALVSATTPELQELENIMKELEDV